MLPLVSRKDIVKTLRAEKLSVEVFDEMPSDETNVRHGIYVSLPLVQDSESIVSGFGCGELKGYSDAFDILVISTQDDIRLERVGDAITNLPESALMAEYTDVDFTTERSYENRAEYRTYSFIGKRI